MQYGCVKIADTAPAMTTGASRPFSFDRRRFRTYSPRWRMIRSSAARSSAIGSRLCSARAGWAWSTGPGTSGSTRSARSSCFRRSSPDDEAFRERFEREWRLAASIEHPNIVEVLDAGEADDHLYILMRLVDGPDLAKLVAEEGPLPPERTLDPRADRRRPRRRPLPGPRPPGRHPPEHPRRGGRPCVPRRLRRRPDDGDAGADTHRLLRRKPRLCGTRADRGQDRSTAAPTSTRSAACSSRA